MNSVKPKSLHQVSSPLKGSIKTPSRLLVLTLGTGCVGAVTFFRSYSSHAYCEYKPKNRISAFEDSHNKTEPKLPWNEFFKLVLPDIWYLIGAILVCIFNCWKQLILYLQLFYMLMSVKKQITLYLETSESSPLYCMFRIDYLTIYRNHNVLMRIRSVFMSVASC